MKSCNIWFKDGVLMVYVCFPLGSSERADGHAPHYARLLQSASQPHTNFVGGQQHSIATPDGGEYQCLHVPANVSIQVPQLYQMNS